MFLQCLIPAQKSPHYVGLGFPLAGFRSDELLLPISLSPAITIHLPNLRISFQKIFLLKLVTIVTKISEPGWILSCGPPLLSGLYPWHAKMSQIDFRFIYHIQIPNYLFQPAGRLTWFLGCPFYMACPDHRRSDGRRPFFIFRFLRYHRADLLWWPSCVIGFSPWVVTNQPRIRTQVIKGCLPLWKGKCL